MDACNWLVKPFIYYTYKIELFSVMQSEKLVFQFLLYDRGTGRKHYQSQAGYATKQEAYRQAQFICLRIALDREASPTLIVDWPTRKILALNLPAFCLLGIDAVGFEANEFIVESPSDQPVSQDWQETPVSCQSLWLRTADGQLMSCQIHAQRWVNCPQWMIITIEVVVNY